MADASITMADTKVLNEIQPVSPTLVLKLRKPKTEKEVKWATDTIDNEHMNKKKSKCCCIYEKPKMFGESSDEDDDITGHCRGHKHKCYRKDMDNKHGPACSGGADNSSAS